MSEIAAKTPLDSSPKDWGEKLARFSDPKVCTNPYATLAEMYECIADLTGQNRQRGTEGYVRGPKLDAAIVVVRRRIFEQAVENSIRWLRESMRNNRYFTNPETGVAWTKTVLNDAGYAGINTDAARHELEKLEEELGKSRLFEE